MNFKLIFAIVAFVILSANCEECPEVCTLEYDPVCGSDGITYGNACSLAQKNCKDKTEITSTEGECLESPSNGCEIQVRCSDQVDPVCGSDGENYTNYCVWYSRNCANPEATYTNGSCTDNEQNETEGCPQFCTKIYQPVCGSDNVTYGNKCLWKQLYCNDTEAIYTDGACPVDRNCSVIACTAIYKPVCGSDGVQYSNKCEAERANCNNPEEIKYTEGECPKPSSNGCKRQVLCTDQENFVCGSDGFTYTNYCLWYVRNCNNSKATYTNGRCTDKEQNETEDCPQFCTKIYQPVCGSDNVTYGNKCLWKQLYCNDTEAIYTDGACPVDRNCSDIACTAIYKPVCGSDGKTYGNACSLAQENCKNKTEITSTEGACETDETATEGKICTTEYEPVCGSDGITYSNVCQFKTNRKDENATYTEGKCHPKDVST